MNHHDRDNHDDVRYVLTEQGMRFLAARAGVPPSTFGEHGAVTYVKEADQDHPERAVHHVEHTRGLNHFMVRLARDARACGWRLVEWRNEAESTCRFVDASGQPAWSRPDASGLIGIGEERVPLLVEYDRGTLEAGNYAAKLDGYRRYYASEAWRTAFTREPALQFVCVDDRAERRVVRAAASVPQRLPLLATTEWRLEQEAGGAFGPVWTAGTDTERRPWLVIPERRRSSPGAEEVNG